MCIGDKSTKNKMSTLIAEIDTMSHESIQQQSRLQVTLPTSQYRHVPKETFLILSDNYRQSISAATTQQA